MWAKINPLKIASRGSAPHPAQAPALDPCGSSMLGGPPQAPGPSLEISVCAGRQAGSLSHPDRGVSLLAVTEREETNCVTGVTGGDYLFGGVTLGVRLFVLIRVCRCE